ncbi:hypothetical protein [Bradyrhizobium sp. SZCCHNPS2010]|uniref:hypothetical protein n=1 Tax=Bradyrhizobium sp. SZCCHNPS2010 TaxID=3057333 RepID=UPI002916EB8C|nr:hypothetical protein [Bradyrhizobium sp. SZCCHNPS2010]
MNRERELLQLLTKNRSLAERSKLSTVAWSIFGAFARRWASSIAKRIRYALAYPSLHEASK